MREMRYWRKQFSLFVVVGLLTACQESFDQRLQREAKEFTENYCPLEPELGTRLDSTVYLIPTRTYATYYSLSPGSERILRENAASFRHLLLQQLIEDVDHKALKDERVTFEYVYYSQESGKVVWKTLIKANEYLQQ